MQAKQRDERSASSWRAAGAQLVPPVLNVLLNTVIETHRMSRLESLETTETL